MSLHRIPKYLYINIVNYRIIFNSNSCLYILQGINAQLILIL